MPKKRAVFCTSLLARLDPQSDRPLHRQLYEEIRGAIVGGALAPGQRIPASRALADDLGVSRTTVLQAVAQLKAEGYLASVVGSGTRVTDVLPDKLVHVSAASAARGENDERPPLSERGRLITSTPEAVRRASPESRTFRVGIPGLDLFPRKLWNRLLVQRARLTSIKELDYGHPSGHQVLREAIARYISSARGVPCRPEQVVVVSGSGQGISFAARLLLDPGDEAWQEEPGYTGARSALLAASARVVPVPVDAHGLDVAEGIRRAPNARLVFVTPSNQYPTGVTMSLQRRLALLDWARQTDAWILEDDYDSEFRYGSRPLMALHGLDGGRRVIYVGTFSKSVFPALRIGFLVVPEELMEAFRRARMHQDQHPPTLQQLTLADFLNGGHFARHVRRMRKAYEQRGRAMVDEMRRELGGLVRVSTPNAGLHLVAHLPPGTDDVEVTRQAVMRGVDSSTLSLHYMEPTTATGLVLGFSSAEPEGLRQSVRRLGQAIQAVAPAASALQQRRPPVSGVA